MKTLMIAALAFGGVLAWQRYQEERKSEPRSGVQEGGLLQQVREITVIGKDKFTGRDVEIQEGVRLAWQPAKGMPRGVMTTVLSGDPERGHSMILMKFPAGTKLPAHSHTPAILATVLSGTLIIGKGERVEPGRGETLEAGALLFEPTDAVHSTQAKTDVILLIHAEGPLDTKYLNPREDPSRQP